MANDEMGLKFGDGGRELKSYEVQEDDVTRTESGMGDGASGVGGRILYLILGGLLLCL
jgi:hypothetical protein